MNIYISNLGYQTTDQELKELFSQYGEVVSAKIITDKFTGKSRGFGFVEMPVDSDGNKAMSELHQAEIGGRTISVTEARPREERPRSNNFGGGGGNYGGGNNRGGNGGGYNKRY